jgi:hypothetical protein
MVTAKDGVETAFSFLAQWGWLTMDVKHDYLCCWTARRHPKTSRQGSPGDRSLLWRTSFLSFSWTFLYVYIYCIYSCMSLRTKGESSLRSSLWFSLLEEGMNGWPQTHSSSAGSSWRLGREVESKGLSVLSSVLIVLASSLFPWLHLCHRECAHFCLGGSVFFYRIFHVSLGPRVWQGPRVWGRG